MMSYLIPPLINASINNVAYPITYTKTLMQLGYEPMAAFKGRSWGFAGSTVTRLPGGISYMKHIVRTDGYIGLTRGFGCRLVCDVVYSVVQDRSKALITTAAGKNSSEGTNDGSGGNSGRSGGPSKTVETNVCELVEECAIESCSKLAAVVISHPFYVIIIKPPCMISVRAMAQFVGRENIYGLPFISAFKDMYSHDGIAGFFAGLIPRALCELLNLWLGKTLYFLMCKYLFTDDNHQLKSLQAYGRLFTPHFTSYFTYPLALTGTIMAVNGSSLMAGSFPVTPVYSSWTDCLNDLIRTKSTSKGSSFFFRIVRDTNRN